MSQSDSEEPPEMAIPEAQSDEPAAAPSTEGEETNQADSPLLGLQRVVSVGQPPGPHIPPAPSPLPLILTGSYSGGSSLSSSPIMAPRVPFVNSSQWAQLGIALHLGEGCSAPGEGFSTGTSTPLTDAKSDSCSLMLPPHATQMGTLDSKSDTNSAMLPFCKICHSAEENQNDNPLISPCRCSGTLQFIHQACLMKWLEISSRKSRKPPKCELCHYQFKKHKKIKFSHWRFPRVSRQDKILHLVFLINLVIMIGCAIATVMCFLSDKGQISKFPRNKADLTSEEITTLSCGVLFFVSFFIAMAVQIKAKHTVYQLFVKCIMQNMEWKIDEYDQTKDDYKPPVLV